MIPQFKGKIQKRSDGVNLQTSEGAAVIQELINYLNKHEPVGPLGWSNGLYRAALYHCQDTGPKGISEHESSDGTDCFTRIGRFGETEGCAGENISFGEDDAMGVVMQLLIDDDVPSRGHRTNIMKAGFHVVGCATGPHKQYGSMCTMDFAGGFIDGSS